jgi:hypothetical protein
MGRNTTADRTPLLMNADQNIGNSTVLVPLNPPLNLPPLPPSDCGTVIPQTNPARILDLPGGSAVGQTASVVFTASRIAGPDNPNPGFAGPVTGIVEFGNGGRFTRVEFDVPIGPFSGLIRQSSNAVEPQDGGTIITVPTGVLRCYARYDNLLISPVLNTDPPLSLSQLLSTTLPPPPIQFLGPGGPTGRSFIIPAENLLVKAMAAYFTKPRSKVYKTNYLYVANINSPTLINVNTQQFFALPAFTKSVKVLRTPISAAVTIVLYDGVHTVDQISVVGGTTCPTIEVVGHECVIGLQSPLPADNYSLLALVCEIGI